MKILLIDIETSPNLAHVWKLWNTDVGLSQLREASEVMCFSAKWYRKPGPPDFYSSFRDGKEAMVSRAHGLLDEADAVVHYNGKRFDVPHLNREFLLAGYRPPAPYHQIDLLNVVKKQFNFPTNRLDYVSRALGLKGKVKHEGHGLWVACMQNDPEAWARMQAYNMQDVALLEDLYDALQPWISGHPSYGAFTSSHVCPNCGSSNLEKRGFGIAATRKYQRYQCRDCGKWSRNVTSIGATDVRELAA